MRLRWWDLCFTRSVATWRPVSRVNAQVPISGATSASACPVSPLKTTVALAMPEARDDRECARLACPGGRRCRMQQRKVHLHAACVIDWKTMDWSSCGPAPTESSFCPHGAVRPGRGEFLFRHAGLWVLTLSWALCLSYRCPLPVVLASFRSAGWNFRFDLGAGPQCTSFLRLVPLQALTP